MCRRINRSALVLAAVLAACDRPAPTESNEASPVQLAASPAPRPPGERAAMDRLARRVALALADPGFRAYVKGELDRSPTREHKLQFQRFLTASGRRGLREVARLNRDSQSAIAADAGTTSTLEMYLPVPAHRAAWSGDEKILVASAQKDHENPIAYDVYGRRQVLSTSTPPATPVLAIQPAETDFGPEVPMANAVTPPPPAPAPPLPPAIPPAGLYLTSAHFVQKFEGWFKGSPEFEIHILGQSGASDSLTDYQCAGEPAGGYYRFDQNNLDWSGRVLLFSQAQLNSYKAAHPNQNFRVIALEDDDTGCRIKFDSKRFKDLQNAIQNQYPNVTGSKDTLTSTLGRIIKRANALQKILSAAYSFITTQDDLIGNAIEAVVVGQVYPGANWIVKGEGNVTNGWIKLEMR